MHTRNRIFTFLEISESQKQLFIILMYANMEIGMMKTFTIYSFTY